MFLLPTVIVSFIADCDRSVCLPFSRDPATPIPPDCPPSFIVCAGSGDRGHAIWTDEYFSPLLKAGVPNLEMHIYGRGGHGGSISPRDGIPFGKWPDRFVDWFRDLGFLEMPGIETKAAKEIAAYAKRAINRNPPR